MNHLRAVPNPGTVSAQIDEHMQHVRGLWAGMGAQLLQMEQAAGLGDNPAEARNIARRLERQAGQLGDAFATLVPMYERLEGDE